MTTPKKLQPKSDKPEGQKIPPRPAGRRDLPRQQLPELPPVKAGMPQLLRGFKDILPTDQRYWSWVRRAVEAEAIAGQFERIDTPILEQAKLFERSVGSGTDIVEKELFRFTDRSGDAVVLRPEATAAVARAYVEHGMVSWPQPVKLWYFGPMFRHDRPQAGRYRQFGQWGYEVLGDGGAVSDAELIWRGYRILSGLGLVLSVQVNSIGDSVCRPGYLKQLVEYYKPRKNQLCENCKERLTTNPLRLLDCKEPDCRELAVDAPQLVDHLCEACREHFVHVLEYLDEFEVPYVLNPRIVRGLDYYTRTTWEYWPEGADPAKPQELGGGGRYDKLLDELAGRPTPASGYAVGVERVILQLKEKGLEPPPVEAPQVFLAQLGDAARKRALKLLTELRAAGVHVATSLSKDGIKPQLEAANRLKTPFALIIGQKELMDGTVIVRDMESGIQEIVDIGRGVPEVQRRLALKREPKTISGEPKSTA